MDNTGTITVRNSFDGGEVVFDKKIQNFSIILSLDPGNESSVIQVPPDCKILTKNIIELRKFAEAHNYDPKQLLTPKIGITSYNSIRTKQTAKFMQDSLQNKNDEEIKQLFETSNYFQMEGLNRLICLFLLEKYSLSYIDKERKEKMNELGVGDYDKSRKQKIKEDYFQYFQAYGEKILIDIESIKK